MGLDVSVGSEWSALKGHGFTRGPRQSRFWIAGVVSRAEKSRRADFLAAAGQRAAPAVGAERINRSASALQHKLPKLSYSLLIPCFCTCFSRKPFIHAAFRAREKKFPVIFPVIRNSEANAAS